MEPHIRFCTSADRTRIAYATLGKGPPIVHIPAWGTNTELDWQARGRGWYEDLARGRRLVWFDRRGTAASQRDVRDFSLEAHVADVSAIVDTLRLERFDLVGPYDAAAVSIAYAARNPQRVERLVLPGAYGSGVETIQPEALRGILELIRGNWGMARRAIANVVFPSGPVEHQKSQAQVFRESMTPEVAARYMEFQGTVDVKQYLSMIEAPTLVITRRDVRIVPIGASRAAAALIPNSRFIALEGDVATGYFEHKQYMIPIREFLDEGRVLVQAAEFPDAGAFRVILFTDLVGHTEMMSRLGDERGREVLREHERITREVLAEHGGTEVKTMGDAFMASFGSVTKTVECAIALQRAFAEREGEPLSIRVGLNAGEPIEEEGDLFGATVILASRIAARAEGGEILVSDNVRSLSAGKGFFFADRGEFVAKGFEEPVRMFEVSWQE